MKTLIFFLILIPFYSSSADCLNLLRLEVAKRLGIKKTYLFGERADQLQLVRKQKLAQRLWSLGNEDFISEERKKDPRYLVIDLAISKDALPQNLKLPLSNLKEDVFDPAKVHEWAVDIYQDALVAIYLDKNLDNIISYDLFNEIPEKLFVQVILDRLSEAGFSRNMSDLAHLDSELGVLIFTQLLKEKKLIIDDINDKSKHGKLIHLLNVDFILYNLKQKGLAASSVIEFYQWMGEVNLIDLGQYKLHPHFDVWEFFFDSTSSGLNSPEDLGPILKQYFNLSNE